MKDLNAPARSKNGLGAEFWVYLSPINNTEEMVQVWRVHFSQGSWSDTITYANPSRMVRAAGRGGTFKVKVEMLDPDTGKWKELKPVPEAGRSANQVECDPNCASMVGMVAKTDRRGKVSAQFWTTSNVICD